MQLARFPWLLVKLSLMDVSRTIESFDSLWFFTNIFSPGNQFSGSACDEIAIEDHVKESPKGKQAGPMCSVYQNQLNELPAPGADNLVPMYSKCGEFAAEVEPQIAHVVEVESLESQRSTEKQERAGTRRRSKRNLYQRRRFLGDLNLDLDVKVVSGSWAFVETCGHQGFGCQSRNRRMPSFGDHMAMKEHLKSWAYAVACIVR